ncbi:MAG: Flavocytochrome c sulfide dehydrogenase flavin-binding protein [Xanthobacteraceae bacterium]|nr:Flavocytochrome c sulfide dehydrogenase flavin-binding protein [Xanthobacteraceae bacterium]
MRLPSRLPPLSRRSLLRGLAAGAAALGAPTVLAQSGPRVVVVGGGFAGASFARALKREDRAISVALVEPSEHYTACPMSNAVIAGLRDIGAQHFGYGGLEDDGIVHVPQRVVRVDAGQRRAVLADDVMLDYDRLVVAPGIDMRFDAIPGYDAAAAELMPHAWKAGEQTLLLRRQLEAMEDGGLVVISAPPNPFRCPPGPYERASLIAHFLKTRKPRSKLIILDAKDNFSKQKLFEQAWAELYPGLVEWVSLSFGGKVTQVDAPARTLTTEFGSHKAAVANVIPPQKAGAIAATIGVADQTGWCPIDPATFESRLVPNVHVIGDAAIGGAMPKSAFTANAQAKACATAIARLLRGQEPESPKLINTCYSLIAPDQAVSIAGVYQPANGLLSEVQGAGGTSPLDAPRSVREEEALYARDWFETITQEAFG